MPISKYWRVAREPRYSLTFALPLLVAYEVLALLLSGQDMAGVRNGADVLLKQLFVAFGGRHGLILFGAVLLGGGAWMVVRDWSSRQVEWWVFPVMLLESVLYALAFGIVTGALTGLLLPGLGLVAPAADLSIQVPERWSLATQLMISLGAGIYEELLFRVLLVSGLALLGRVIFAWSRIASGIFAVVAGALIFSAFHYIGPYGDSFQLTSFTFRAVAGVLFSGLYLLRGFGVTAWTHALYDVLLAVSG
jgi:Type II CAAX prenyl endopeptidase Rce1-like